MAPRYKLPADRGYDMVWPLVVTIRQSILLIHIPTSVSQSGESITPFMISCPIIVVGYPSTALLVSLSGCVAIFVAMECFYHHTVVGPQWQQLSFGLVPKRKTLKPTNQLSSMEKIHWKSINIETLGFSVSFRHDFPAKFWPNVDDLRDKKGPEPGWPGLGWILGFKTMGFIPKG